uniref:Uncharacterized protein n=1 Tax=Arundo donax TaxID=35708 RepID=A0A0A9U3K4_ARUDO
MRRRSSNHVTLFSTNPNFPSVELHRLNKHTWTSTIGIWKRDLLTSRTREIRSPATSGWFLIQ